MHIDRMKHAIALLNSIQPEQWDYRDWVTGEFTYEGSTPTPTCDTVACAGGWMALNPICNKQGLTLSDSGYPIYGDATGVYPIYGDASGVVALARYLEIPGKDAMHIFCDL